MTTITKYFAITKNFDSLKKAERYQNRLYNQYDIVRLIKAPRFTEDGQYVWNVSAKA